MTVSSSQGSQGLEGCQVPVGLGEMAGEGAHLEPLDRRDPRDLQVRADWKWKHRRLSVSRQL